MIHVTCICDEMLPATVGNVLGGALTETVGWTGLVCICLPTLVPSLAGAAAGFSVHRAAVFIRGGVTLVAGSGADFKLCSLEYTRLVLH